MLSSLLESMYDLFEGSAADALATGGYYVFEAPAGSGVPCVVASVFVEGEQSVQVRMDDAMIQLDIVSDDASEAAALADAVMEAFDDKEISVSGFESFGTLERESVTPLAVDGSIQISLHYRLLMKRE